ncbi:hypothetical protein [Geotalea uraniireducens]|uniref:Uncharacterized protein n=1 Tax=Geotalea uraniireducens (strain Rf4) TaxID=351605 RepID=A5GF20_GEOUR|nr:hypothetical protein [Geotalea uraniireducens]ABQ26025.1 hypothetical protein Gura_1835 [Geotalea uraniireducens Rf4]
MRIILFFFTLLSASFLLLSACGSGTPEPTTRHAVLKLSTQGTLATGKIGAIDNITITLPSGVTVPTDATGKVLSGVISPSGQTATGTVVPIIDSIFTPATTGSQATLTIKMVVAAGFDPGEFATVTCNITGSVPSATDFSINQATFKTKDLNGADITGLTASFTMSII